MSTRAALIASVTAAALLIGGTGAALAATGTLSRWIPGLAGQPADTAAGPLGYTDDGTAPRSFADGVELAWRVDSDAFVTPKTGPDTASSWLGGHFDRATIGLDSPFYPAATKNAVMFVARGVDSKLVLLDAADGTEIWSTEIRQGHANCAPAAERVERFYCVAAGDEGEPSVLWEVTASGEATSTEVAPGLSRVATSADRIVLASMFTARGEASAVALDLDGRELWSSDNLHTGGYYGITIAGERTLLRSGGSWTLLDGTGATVATGTGASVYEGGDGSCDALLTPGGHLVAASTPERCDTVTGSVVWGGGRDILDVHAVTIDGEDAIVRSNAESGTTVSTFAADGSLAELWSDPRGGAFVGATGGEGSALVVRGSDSSHSFSAATGELLAEWSQPEFGFEAGYRSDQLSVPTLDLVLDEHGTSVSNGALVDVTTGGTLGALAYPTDAHEAWLTYAGLLVTERGCPDCSTAGGNGSDRFLSLYRPIDSGGSGSAATAALPAGMPQCPDPTVLLAWAEYTNGWVLVCGYDATTPAFVQVRPADGSADIFSIGAKSPASKEALAACKWDPDTRRITATLTDGSRIVLDYDLGTLSVVDGSGKTTLAQERFVRYIFVPLGSQLRTLADTAGTSGAFDVSSPDDTAEDQVRYLIEVLERAYEGRALVKSALPKLQNCTASAGGYADSVTAMEQVRDNRAKLLAALDAMPVDLIPDGPALLDDLREAIAQSHTANQEYVAWAKAANASGCAQLSAAGKAAAVASDAPKERFAERWNANIAPKFGVRSVDPWFI
ncbi:hypothetical protein ACFSWE_04750 [Leucobacter albus]|uniref:Pyrroloquinoline-quinone binding quinoprotein n=1 Tax=Leucobacter albus TaxID=272210 RepID=A0ABW3TKD1_9MICO